MNKRHKKKLRKQKEEHGNWHKIDFEELFSHDKHIQAMIKQMENKRGLRIKDE